MLKGIHFLSGKNGDGHLDLKLKRGSVACMFNNILAHKAFL